MKYLVTVLFAIVLGFGCFVAGRRYQQVRDSDEEDQAVAACVYSGEQTLQKLAETQRELSFVNLYETEHVIPCECAQ